MPLSPSPRSCAATRPMGLARVPTVDTADFFRHLAARKKPALFFFHDREKGRSSQVARSVYLSPQSRTLRAYGATQHRAPCGASIETRRTQVNRINHEEHKPPAMTSICCSATRRGQLGAQREKPRIGSNNKQVSLSGHSRFPKNRCQTLTPAFCSDARNS